MGNNNQYFLISILCTFIVIYSIIMPNYENPDELIHYHQVFKEKGLILNISGDGNLYYFILNNLTSFFGIDEQDLSSSVNTDFKYFGNQFRFNHISEFASWSIIQVRLLNLFFIIPTLLLFLRKNFFHYKIASISLVLPGVMWFFSIINPDVLSVCFSFIIFKYFFKRKFLMYALIVAGYFLLDRTVILFFLAIGLSEIYNRLSSNLLKAIFWIILIISFIKLYLIGQEIIYVGRSTFEPIKSILGVIFSFYGLTGAMSIKASLLEYSLVLFLTLIFIYKLIKPGKLMYFPFFKKSRSIILFYSILWFYLLTFAPTLDQGRYFYFILPFILIIFYFIFERRFNLFFDLRNLIIIGLLSNFSMFFSILLIQR